MEVDAVHQLDPGHGLRERMVSCDGRVFRTVVAGHGPVTVVFEAGLSAAASEWAAVQRAVSEQCSTLSYDRSGYGGSQPTIGSRLLPGLADDLESVLAASRVSGPLVVVGHSWGAPILRTFAQSTARPLRGVVLVDGTMAVVMRPRDVRQIRVVFGLLHAASRVGLHTPALRSALEVGSWTLPTEDCDLALRDMQTRDAIRAVRGEIAAIGQTDLEALERQGFPEGVPVTFLVGSVANRGFRGVRARLCEAARREAAQVSGRYVEAEHSSHYIPQQQPDVVAAEILRLAHG